MTNNMNNMNNINNINQADLLFLSNKELYNKYMVKKTTSYDNIAYDVIKYKKEIKSKTNKLLQNYVDSSGNIDALFKCNNDTVKYKNHFYLFLCSLIENIKLQELKKDIRYDLSGYTNYDIANVPDNNDSNTDFSFSDLLNINVEMGESNGNLNKNKKVLNLDSFVNVKNRVPKPKILPKKRSK